MYLFVRNVSYLCMVDWHVMTLVSSYDIFSYILCSCSISSYLYILASQDATKAGGSFFFCFVPLNFGSPRALIGAPRSVDRSQSRLHPIGIN
jgi:hypothetical protein